MKQSTSEVLTMPSDPKARRAGSIVTKREDWQFSSHARHEAAIRRLQGMRWADDLNEAGAFSRLLSAIARPVARAMKARDARAGGR